MTRWTRLRSLLRAALQRSRAERELDAELRFHIEAYAEDLVRSGVPLADALRRARIEFGGLEQAKEQCRDATGIGIFETLLQDLRFALRQSTKTPWLALTAVLILALGMGVS